MLIRSKFWWFATISIALTLLIISSVMLYFWSGLSASQKSLLIDLCKDNFIYLFCAVVLGMAALVFALDGIFHTYILPIYRLKDDIALISSVNPFYRIKGEGNADIVQLVEHINRLADSHQQARLQVHRRVKDAKEEVELEKEILASVMAELPQGVVICNAQGRILMINRMARGFLEASCTISSGEDGNGQCIGIGRMIFPFICQDRIDYLIDELQYNLSIKKSDSASYFIMGGGSMPMLHIEAAPVQSILRVFIGFMLVITDISARIKTDKKFGQLLDDVNTCITDRVRSVQARFDRIGAGDDKTLESCGRGRHDLEYIVKLANSAVVEYRLQRPLLWRPSSVGCQDLAGNIRKIAQNQIDMTIRVSDVSDACMVHVDGYIFLKAVMFALKQIKTETGCKHVDLAARAQAHMINFVLSWACNIPVSGQRFQQWRKQIVIDRNGDPPLTLDEIMNRQNGSVTFDPVGSEANCQSICFSLPKSKADAMATQRRVAVVSESRPEFYDFDLFHQAGQLTGIDNMALADLSYTVFDTETTGLDPRGGDEIIAIGAVRIVNGRLLSNERFDKLVNPGRSVPYSSVKIHGIHPDMLHDQPGIDVVLPQFKAFVDDTILVAHNAAFDMRMLQMKEEVTGIVFTNPVLDTLLLSAVCHPAHRNHDLEFIARRLGIDVIGRHSAIGDAITTGAVFLKLIELLHAKGVVTLGQARDASRKCYYARLRY